MLLLVLRLFFSCSMLISTNTESIGLDGSTPIFDPGSIGIWARVCASIFMRAVAVETDHLDTCGTCFFIDETHLNLTFELRVPVASTQTLFSLYVERFNTGSASKKILDLRQTFQYSWFSIMKDLKTLRLRPSDKLYPFFVQWKIIGRQLGIPSNAQQPQDPAAIGANNVVCCWAECLCHWSNPCRHKLRICKGCYVVMYCGKRCQEL